MPTKNFLKNKQGMTIIEILIALAIFGLIIGAISAFAADTVSLRGVIFQGLSGEQEAKKIIRPMANEIRSATQSSVGSFMIKAAEPYRFTFYADTNGDGLKEEISYYLDGTVMKRSSITPAGAPLAYDEDDAVVVSLVHNVVSAPGIFFYYDTNYDGTTAALTAPIDLLQVRLVKITLTIDADPNRPPAPIDIETQVSIRNLKDNF